MGQVVFARVKNDGSPYPFLLFEGEADKFLADPDEYAVQYLEASLVDYWVVPDKLENIVAGGGNMREVLDIVLSIDAISDDAPHVSDMIATIFEAGYQLGRRGM